MKRKLRIILFIVFSLLVLNANLSEAKLSQDQGEEIKSEISFSKSVLNPILDWKKPSADAFLIPLKVKDKTLDLFCRKSLSLSEDALITSSESFTEGKPRDHKNVKEIFRDDKYRAYECGTQGFEFDGRITIKKGFFENDVDTVRGVFQGEKFRSYGLVLGKEKGFLKEVEINLDPKFKQSLGNDLSHIPSDRIKKNIEEITRRFQADRNLNGLESLIQIRQGESYEIELGVFVNYSLFKNIALEVARIKDPEDPFNLRVSPDLEENDGDEWAEDGYDDRIIDERTGRIIEDSPFFNGLVFEAVTTIEDLIASANVYTQKNINAYVKVKQLILLEYWLDRNWFNRSNQVLLLVDFSDFDFDVEVDSQALLINQELDVGHGISGTNMCSRTTSAFISRLNFPNAESLNLFGENHAHIERRERVGLEDRLIQNHNGIVNFIHEMTHVFGVWHTFEYDPSPAICDQVLQFYSRRHEDDFINEDGLDLERINEIESDPAYHDRIRDFLDTELGHQQIRAFTDYDPELIHEYRNDIVEKMLKVGTMMRGGDTVLGVLDAIPFVDFDEITRSSYCLSMNNHHDVLAYTPFIRNLARFQLRQEDFSCLEGRVNHVPVVERFSVSHVRDLGENKEFIFRAQVQDVDFEDDLMYFLWTTKDASGSIINQEMTQARRVGVYGLMIPDGENLVLNLDVYDKRGKKAIFPVANEIHIANHILIEDIRHQGGSNEGVINRIQRFEIDLNMNAIQGFRGHNQFITVNFGDGESTRVNLDDAINGGVNRFTVEVDHIYNQAGRFLVVASYDQDLFDESQSVFLRIYSDINNHRPELIGHRIVNPERPGSDQYISTEAIRYDIEVRDDDLDQWVEGQLGFFKDGRSLVMPNSRALPPGVGLGHDEHRLLSIMIPENTLESGEWQVWLVLMDAVRGWNIYNLGAIDIQAEHQNHGPDILSFHIEDAINPNMPLVAGRALRYRLVVRDDNFADELDGYISTFSGRPFQDGDPHILLNQPILNPLNPGVRVYEIVSDELSKNLPFENVESIRENFNSSPVVYDGEFGDSFFYEREYLRGMFLIDYFNYTQEVSPLENFEVNTKFMYYSLQDSRFMYHISFPVEIGLPGNADVFLLDSPEYQGQLRTGLSFQNQWPRYPAGQYMMRLSLVDPDLEGDALEEMRLDEFFPVRVLNVAPVIEEMTLERVPQTPPVDGPQASQLHCEGEEIRGLYSLEINADDYNNDDLTFNWRVNRGIVEIRNRQQIFNEGQIVGEQVEALIHTCSEESLRVQVCDPSGLCVEQVGPTQDIFDFIPFPVPVGEHERIPFIPFPGI